MDPVQSGLSATADKVAEYARAYGRDGNIFQNLATYLRCRLRPVSLQIEAQNADLGYIRSCIAQNTAEIRTLLGDSEYTPDYEKEQLVMKKGWGQLKLDEAGLEEAIIRALQAGETELSYSTLVGGLLCPDFDAIHAALMQEPRDAAFTDDGRFDVIDEVVGCSFDVAAAQQLWTEAAPAADVVIPMTVTWPSVTGQQLRDSLYRDLLGACTTSYWNSSPNRISNVELASAKIDGTILYPGEVFSYNEVVGERTLEGGFLPAPAYVDGDVKDEVGGGACQVSSTLYAATLFAFLETVERTNHYFPVSYLPDGLDATVSWQSPDFRFVNNTAYPIKIIASTNTSSMTLNIEIWGTNEAGTHVVMTSDTSKIFDPNNPSVATGYTTTTYRNVYNSANQLISSNVEAKSTYHYHTADG